MVICTGLVNDRAYDTINTNTFPAVQHLHHQPRPYLADFDFTIIGDLTLQVAGATRWLAPHLLDPD
jgi:hypothetical protein